MIPFTGFRCQHRHTGHVGTVYRADRDKGIMVNMETAIPYVFPCSWNDFLLLFGPAPAAEVIDLTERRERQAVRMMAARIGHDGGGAA